MTTLSVAVDADDKLWTIDTMPDSPFLEAGDELVEISARFPEHVYRPTMETIPDKIRVRRAVAGTTAATHAQGITLTPVYPESATAVGGGVGVLEDPGVAWQATHVYALGDRFRETIDGAVRVFEVHLAGTSGGGVFADYVWEGLLIPDSGTGTGTEGFKYLGVVGQLPWASSLPGFPPMLDFDVNDGTLHYTNPYPPEESTNMVALRATVAGTPVSIFEMKTDGDADYLLDENAGAGFRFNVAADGSSVVPQKATEITYEKFRVAVAPSSEFTVEYEPFLIRMLGLPTADPGVGHEGELWIDVAAGRVLKVSAG